MASSTPVSPQQVYDTKYVYDKYKNTISELIAYIEVYEHDLPTEVMTQIAELFQSVVFYETESVVKGSDLLLKTYLKITQSMYKHAICLLIQKIQEYKRIFKRFEYKGVRCENQHFFEIAESMEKEITKAFSGKLRKCYKESGIWATLEELTLKNKLRYLLGYIRVSIMPSFLTLKREPYLPINDMIIACMDDVALKGVYEQTKDLLKKYEEISPDVISNGAKQSLKMSVFAAVSGWIIPLLLGIPVMIKLINVIRDWWLGVI